jgi:hypothetical protein
VIRKRDIKQVDAVVRKPGLSEAQRGILHEWMAREKLKDMTYQEILDLGCEVIDGQNRPLRLQPRTRRWVVAEKAQRDSATSKTGRGAARTGAE